MARLKKRFLPTNQPIFEFLFIDFSHFSMKFHESTHFSLVSFAVSRCRQRIAATRRTFKAITGGGTAAV